MLLRSHAEPIRAAVPQDGRALMLHMPDGSRLRLTADAVRATISNIENGLSLLEASATPGVSVVPLRGMRHRLLAPSWQQFGCELRDVRALRGTLLLTALLLMPLMLSATSLPLVALLVADARSWLVAAALAALALAILLSLALAWRLLARERHRCRHQDGPRLRAV